MLLVAFEAIYSIKMRLQLGVVWQARGIGGGKCHWVALQCLVAQSFAHTCNIDSLLIVVIAFSCHWMSSQRRARQCDCCGCNLSATKCEKRVKWIKRVKKYAKIYLYIHMYIYILVCIYVCDKLLAFGKIHLKLFVCMYACTWQVANNVASNFARKYAHFSY